MSYAVVNPATGETIKTFPTITDAELDATIAAADEAHRTWSKSTTVEERAGLVHRVGELHVERRQELAEIIVREMGKPIDRPSARSTSRVGSTSTTPTTRPTS
jgi:succinate-semialdehyde dehydrogenase/glutarate-semialdehyde dehydrogenase